MVIWVKLVRPFGHHLDQVTGAEFEGEIPSYAEHDDFLVKLPTLKGATQGKTFYGFSRDLLCKLFAVNCFEWKTQEPCLT